MCIYNQFFKYCEVHKGDDERQAKKATTQNERKRRKLPRGLSPPPPPHPKRNNTLIFKVGAQLMLIFLASPDLLAPPFIWGGGIFSFCQTRSPSGQHFTLCKHSLLLIIITQEKDFKVGIVVFLWISSAKKERYRPT